MLGDARGTAVELDEEMRRLGQRELRIEIARPDLHLVEQFDARDRQPGLNRRDRRRAGAVDGVEGAHRDRHLLGDAVQLQGHLGDDAERALGSDEEPRQIIPGRRFSRSPGGADQAAIGQHGRDPDHILAHRAVANRVGAGGARRRHAAEAGIGPGIDREEQALVAQMAVQLHAGDAGLDRAIQVLRIDRQDRVHPAEVERNAAVRRVHLALQRGAGAERDDGHAILGAKPHDVLHLAGGLRIDDRVGQLRRVPGHGIRMLGAQRLRGRDTLAEPAPKRLDHLQDRGPWRSGRRCTFTSDNT